mmetsp:Transcript_46917/g.69775  ORF Transcript_46917/g.69775 Transcript_46917/m.69775 type:complete len:99 (-) Transcript_46917:213-509(-)
MTSSTSLTNHGTREVSLESVTQQCPGLLLVYKKLQVISDVNPVAGRTSNDRGIVSAARGLRNAVFCPVVAISVVASVFVVVYLLLVVWTRTVLVILLG